MKQEKRIIWFLCVVLIVSGGIWYTGRTVNKSYPASFSEESGIDDNKTDTEASQQASADTLSESGEMAVYICGAVKHPGVYRFSGDARVCDVVEAAGGLTKKADSSAVNQARHIQDGEQIQIPAKQESSAAKKSSEADTGLEAASSGGKLNINTAGKEELMTLPGIGEAKAAAIIAYREEHGLFQKPEDIMKISGIKNGVYQKICEKITV
ncbi:MAG: helix-hairpin-helix domain-containing protein [Lachnospiraceae bacterium]|nr:helix-hairpin-helix domain-containing protein [Lachnospiraceae bacterium]